jgi:hypothetical protein
VTVVSKDPALGDDGMLLSCIARMPSLQHLMVSLQDFDWPDDAEVYSALAASSNLQHLQLTHHDLPGGIWQEMFPLGKTWPFLQVGDVCRAPWQGLQGAHVTCDDCGPYLHADAGCNQSGWPQKGLMRFGINGFTTDWVAHHELLQPVGEEMSRPAAVAA